MGKVALPVVPDPPFDTAPHWRMNVLSVTPLRKGIFRYPLPDKSPVIPFRLAAFPKPTIKRMDIPACTVTSDGDGHTYRVTSLLAVL